MADLRESGSSLARLLGTQPARHTGRPTETFFAPIRQAFTGPTLTEAVAQMTPQEPSALGLGANLLSGLERVGNVAVSPLIGGARLVEQGVEHLPRLIGQEPASTPVSRVAGALAEAAGMVAPGLIPRPIAGTAAAPGSLSARMAPVQWTGFQERFKPGLPPLELWTLTEAIPDHPAGSTVTRQTLESKGFVVPPPPGGGR